MTEENAKDHGVLYLGIDLGTSRTSVSSSNGVRETIASIVGYPKDVVAQKLLKKDVLFGDEAVRHRLSLDFYRPLQHGVLKGSDDGSEDKNLKAAQDLISEVIRTAKPRKDELIYAVIGAPAQASINNKEAIIKAAKESVDSVMLCSEPFAVAYGLDWLEDVLVIDIGAGTVDLCRMHGTMPEDTDQVTLNTAGDFVDEQLSALLKESRPEAQFSIQMIKEIKERYASVSEEMERVKVFLPVNGKPTEFDITDEMREACESLLPPVVETTMDLISRVEPEYQAKVRNNVILSGGTALIKGFGAALQETLKELGGGKVRVVKDPVYVGSDGGLAIAIDAPEGDWHKLEA